MIKKRRSNSFSEFNSPSEEYAKILRSVIKPKQVIEPENCNKIPNTDVKTHIPVYNRRTNVQLKIRRPVAKNLFNPIQSGSSPFGSEAIGANTATSSVKKNEETKKSVYKTKSQNSPLNPFNSLTNTSSKKSLFKRILETATPRKSATPRHFDINDASLDMKNITVTNYTDIEECKKCIFQVMEAKKINCSTKK